MVRQIGTLKLSLKNILEYHPKSSKESTICDHLLIWNNTPYFDEFAYFYHKYNVEVKESMFIKPDRPVLNGSIGSAKLFLFDNN